MVELLLSILVVQCTLLYDSSCQLLLCPFSFFHILLSSSFSRYMVTTGFDAKIRVWDVRQYKPVNCFPTVTPPSSLDISQRGLVAFGYSNHCEVSIMSH